LSLEQLQKEINKQYKSDLMMKGSKIKPMQRWSSGSVALDFELGGGYPTGKIITIVGEYSDGKTSLALLATAEFQKAFPDAEVLWIDAEGAWDETWAATIGVRPDSVWVVQSEYQQQAYDIVNKAIEHGVGLVVVDSVAALVPKEEAEGSFEDWSIGLAARVNSKAMRGFQSSLNTKATEKVAEEGIPPTIILLNQLRDKIGPYASKSEPGGKAIGFHSSIKIMLRKGDYFPKPKNNSNFTDESVVTPKAQQIKFFIEKNKTAPARKSSHLWWFFDNYDSIRRKGTIDKVEEMFRYAKLHGLVQNRGKWYDIMVPGFETQTFEGSNRAAEYIRTNPPVWEAMRKELMRLIEKSYEPTEEPEVANTNKPATDETAGEASSEETEGEASGGFWSDTLGEGGREDEPLVSAA
jgi:recombination protein RecA